MSHWKKWLFPITMLLTLAIADAPALAQWVHHRFVEDTRALTDQQT